MYFKIICTPDGKNRFEQEYSTEKEAGQAVTAIAQYAFFLRECGLMDYNSGVSNIYKRDSSGGWVEIKQEDKKDA